MGRPLKEIDADQVERLASIGCTQDEIAGFFGVDQSTISRRFASEMALGASRCKISLRRRQWKAAGGGNVPMLIHLGKQILGQSDRHAFDFSGLSDAELISRAKGLVGGDDEAGPDDRADG